VYFAFLGTSGAVASAERDTTSLMIASRAGVILLDCGGGPVHRLRQLGVDPLGLSHVVITHIHPDHAYGLPSLVQNLVLLGRRAPLTVVCRPEHVEPLRALLGIFALWPARDSAFALDFTPVGLDVGAFAFETGGLRVRTAPNAHGSMPNFAVRIEPESGPAVIYSSDTEPTDSVVALARGADTLVHEATFPERHRGRYGAHTTAADAGRVAARAGVRRLILTHIDADYHGEVDALASEARATFGGVVEVARELVAYPLG
jgi:ribonuclease Z